nr:PREDICTED: alanine and arginine-rich domain-containing protein [Rhinolophus sinicus]
MGLGDLGRCREGMPRGHHAVAVRVRLWPSAPGEEAPATSMRLEDLRLRLVPAFQCAVQRGASRRSGWGGAESGGLRAELLEMRFQNRHLAKTLLDLNMKMQQLKKEYALEIASKSQSSEDNAVNLE